MVLRRHQISAALITAASVLLLAFPASARLMLQSTPVQRVASSPTGEAQFVSTKAVGSEFTLKTISAVSGKALYADGDTMWLAGIGSQTGKAPDTLAVTWTPKQSWLGFTWTLQLYSEAGLLPADLLKPVGGDPSITAVDLVQANPLPGHKYETLFSYSATNGALSLRVTDLTDDSVVYQGTFATKEARGALYAVAGTAQKPSADDKYGFAVESVEVHPRYLPVGLSWAAGLNSTDNDFLPMLRFELSDTVSVQTKSLGSALSGTLQILSVNDKATKTLSKLQPLQAVNLTQVAAKDFPLGRSTLRLEYSENGTVLLSDTQEITVGVAKLRFENVTLDKNRQHVVGKVAVSSSGVIKGIDLKIKAKLEELVWNDTRRTYEAKLVDSMTLFDKAIDIPDKNPAEIPLSISLPERVGYWRVTFAPETEQSIGTMVENLTQSFTNYAPAVLEPGEAFTIAVLPDTQYMVKSYPDIFTRQIQWIAEQAAERNIALTLHLGDVTDNNTQTQWATAAQGMQLLNGVMPFVLAQGNHDLTTGGGSVQNRDNSLINSFFPLANQPWITGTFEKNRIENSYSLFTFLDQKYLILSLEFGPRDEVLDWANQVVAAHPDYKVIMITHNYTGSSGGRSNSARSYDIANNPNTSVNAGPDMWYDLVQKHHNFQLVLSGHIHSDAIPRQVALGQNRNWVYEMLIDYQSDPNGGNGYLVLVTFHPDGRIEVRSYSPYLGQNRTMRDRYGYSNHFIIEADKGRFVNP